jgi:hypothetical protein
VTPGHQESLRRCVIAAAVALAACGSGLVAAGEANDDPSVAALLARRCIEVPTSGCVTGSFARLQELLARTNLLSLIQDAYARQLPPGAKPEFVVHQTGSNTFAYVNRHDEHCAIREVERRADGTQAFSAGYYVEGERFFGRFESYVHIVVSNQTDRLRFQADVHAWPHNAVIRLLIRHVPPVERYFREKTGELSTLACRVLCDLDAHEPAAPKGTR